MDRERKSGGRPLKDPGPRYSRPRGGEGLQYVRKCYVCTQNPRFQIGCIDPGRREKWLNSFSIFQDLQDITVSHFHVLSSLAIPSAHFCSARSSTSEQRFLYNLEYVTNIFYVNYVFFATVFV